ncbi:hypothetical protein [Marinimicrobium agarilyticum]|uniref:hypothetical protein n=1 Tax=Marinimicrobium agarilyticum TaxID=306546 RepID=UPI0012F6BB6B|nr:hypothetical protein [Marinimicrobium agarilyticum]
MMRYLVTPGRATHGWTATRLVAAGFLLCACATEPPVPEPDEPEALTTEVPASEPAPAQTREEKVEQWLEQADRALANDRLLSPLADNAHDRYRAVLLYDADNTRAITGLQAIALRYLDLARSAAARSALTQARGYLELAETVDPGNPLVEELRQSLQTQRERMVSAEAMVEKGRTISLDPTLLSQRADSLVADLHSLAQRVKESGKFVLIVTRTDAEGRWVYQQMRDGVSDYVLRGDIKLGSPPRIELQSPL